LADRRGAETLRHDVRMTRAAINDMSRVNITAGEVEAMYTTSTAPWPH